MRMTRKSFSNLSAHATKVQRIASWHGNSLKQILFFFFEIKSYNVYILCEHSQSEMRKERKGYNIKYEDVMQVEAPNL